MGCGAFDNNQYSRDSFALFAWITNNSRESIREALVTRFLRTAPLNPSFWNIAYIERDNSANGLQVEVSANGEVDPCSRE